MAGALRVTLVANAGLLLEYEGITLLLDGIYGAEGHPFSTLKPEVWDAMLSGKAPFQRVDYLLFTHAHPDHFSPEMTREFLRHRRVKGVFLPEGADEDGLIGELRADRTPCVKLSEQTDRAAFRIEPDITVRAFSALHLDKKYHSVRHFCYLIDFGGKQVLFTADVDYTQESFERLREIPLRAVFVNPLFFNVLRHGRFFTGELKTQSICIYHVPFSQDDRLHMRPALAHDLVEWPPEKQETIVLCDAFQHIEL